MPFQYRDTDTLRRMHQALPDVAMRRCRGRSRDSDDARDAAGLMLNETAAAEAKARRMLRRRPGRRMRETQAEDAEAAAKEMLPRC